MIDKIKGLLIIFVSIILCFSLIFHHYNDVCINIASNYSIQNNFGFFGASISDLLLQFFGIFIFLAPFAYIFYGFQIFLKKNINLTLKTFNLFVIILICNLTCVVILNDHNVIYIYKYNLTGAFAKIIEQNNLTNIFLNILLTYSAILLGIKYFSQILKLIKFFIYKTFEKIRNKIVQLKFTFQVKERSMRQNNSKKINEIDKNLVPNENKNFELNNKTATNAFNTFLNSNNNINFEKNNSNASVNFEKNKAISYNKTSRYQDDLFASARAADKLNKLGNSLFNNQKTLKQSSNLFDSIKNSTDSANSTDIKNKKDNEYFANSNQINNFEKTNNNRIVDSNYYLNENYLEEGQILYDDNIKQNISDHLEKQEISTQKEVEENYSNYKYPSVGLLKSTFKSLQIQSFEEIKQNTENLLKILNDFGIDGAITDVHQGPVVTSYEFEPKPGIKISRVIGLADDIARSLLAISTRIGTIPGKSALAIEIPNTNRYFFNIKELIEFLLEQCQDMLLPIILGKDQLGSPLVVDLAKMPHLLVAGTTGSGKSVAINTMIFSLLYKYSPEDCKFIMIDPKMLELNVYSDIPHLLAPIITESSKAISVLKWAVKEMENRYKMMSNLGVRNIENFNLKVTEITKTSPILTKEVHTGFDSNGNPTYEKIEIKLKKMPFIVIIIDEMADLMLTAGKEIENLIQRLAQMARAAGIHIIMATQRPSVDIITGVIKANLPSRISFKVISKIDSRTILGQMGAEQLLGMGDMLYLGNSQKIIRAHGPFVEDSEVEKLVDFLKSQGKPNYIKEILTIKNIESTIQNRSINSHQENDENLYNQALEIIKRDRKIQASYLQKVLRITYNKAITLIEQMEHNGVISAPGLSGQREIIED